MSLTEKEKRFIEVYNDLENYPTLQDVALELGISYQTVRNRSTLLRARARRGEDVPALVSRVVTAQKADNDNQLTARDHARNRANKLREEIADLLQRSRYPVVNPEAVIVESFVYTAYDRISGRLAEREGTPRTWIADTLRVEGVEDPRGRKFIFTGAQNDAEVHEEFWKNLKAYAAYLDADIVVGPWTYETQWWSENNPTSRSYDPAIQEFLCFGQMTIGENFVFAGEMNTLPTAARPIGDLASYSRGRWAVFPHAKIQLKSIPTTDPDVPAHQIMTTGAVTKPKVIPRKAGVKSIFHHVIGAVIVEFDEDGDLFCRQISADEEGAFYDLDVYVYDGQIFANDRVAAIIAGDVHLRKLDSKNALATFGFDPVSGATQAGSLVETLKPEKLLLHDLFDNETRNHHHANDNAYFYEMAYRNRDSVFQEVADGAAFLTRLKGAADEITVVDSNHDIALERYVREGRYRGDGINHKFGLRLELAYIEYREELANAIDNNLPAPTFSLLEWAMRDIAGSDIDHVNWVHDGQSYVIGEVECGHHGFRGANGAKGTVIGFANLGRKMNIGDKHSPEILDGVYVAGCMNLHHGYNKGPSGWSITHIVQYPNGKRTLVTLQNGKWRA